jgi:hypothetical protein
MACGGLWDDAFCAFCTPFSSARKKLKTMIGEEEAEKMIKGTKVIITYLIIQRATKARGGLYMLKRNVYPCHHYYA